MNFVQQKQSLILRGAVVTTMIVLAAVLRIIPHPWNPTPIGAMALFSGAMCKNRWTAFTLPLASLLAVDVLVAFHKLIWIVSASFATRVSTASWAEGRPMVVRLGGCGFMC